MIKKFIQIVKTPYIVMPVLSALIVIGWIQLVAPAQTAAFDIADKNKNILSNASFEQWDNELPVGWDIDATSRNEFQVNKVPGYINGSGLGVDIDTYRNGNVDIKSAKTEISPGTSYLFKSFYETDTQLDLILEKTNKNGETSQELLRHYPDYDYPWSTMSGVINTSDNDRSIRVFISVSGKGYIELDSAYIIPTAVNSSVDMSQENNLIKNAGWEFYEVAGLTATPSYQNNEFSINVSEHQIGQVAWKPGRVVVKPSEQYTFAAEYQSNRSAEIGVDYMYADGTSSYQVIESLNPVAQFTKVKVSIEVPKDAISMQPSVQISSKGTLVTKNAQLYFDSAAKSFDAPRVSITFDDGWMSSYTNGASLLDDYGFSGTFYINPGVTGEDLFMSKDNIKDLLRRNHQIASHTYTHIDLTSYAVSEVTKELDRSNQEIKKYGVNEIDFASPYGKTDSSVLPLLKDRQSTHRGTNIGVNTRQNYDGNNLLGLFMRKELSDEELKEYIEQAKASNGWLILIYHEIEPSESPFALDYETLERHLKLIRKSDIQVQTVRQAASQLESQIR